MEKDYVIESIKELLTGCNDLEMLYLIKDLLSA